MINLTCSWSWLVLDLDLFNQNYLSTKYSIFQANNIYLHQNLPLIFSPVILTSVESSPSHPMLFFLWTMQSLKGMAMNKTFKVFSGFVFWAWMNRKECFQLNPKDLMRKWDRGYGLKAWSSSQSITTAVSFVMYLSIMMQDTKYM